MNNLLNYAQKYAETGLKVFPLTPLSKIPIKGTSGSKEATTDVSQIEEWWNVTPQANLGLVTDKFLVIDVDVHDKNTNGYESLKILENTFEPLPKTLRVATANNGLHIYLMKPNNVSLPQKISFMKGLDIKAHPHNYIVAPPSEVRRLDGSIGDYKIEDSSEIAQCPDWLIDFIKNNTEKEITYNDFSSPKRYRNKTTILLENLVTGAEVGNRNNAVASATGQLLAYGVKSSFAWELIQFMNSNSQSPLDQKELEITFLSICRKELNSI